VTERDTDYLFHMASEDDNLKQDPEVVETMDADEIQLVMTPSTLGEEPSMFGLV
jgi:hypothetical protein